MAGDPQFKVVEWNGKKVFRVLERQVAQNMSKATTLVRRESVAAIRSTPSPSPEGGPPGKDTGDMARAIKKKTIKHRSKPGVTGVVGVLSDRVQYAALSRLVTGYVGRDRLGRAYIQWPRPLFGPVVRKHQRELVRIMTEGG